jgi:SpoVK/Ycf46/Vps4 family AAA+-type ATPase
MTANKTALIDLTHAIEIYQMLINLGPYDRNMATIVASRDHALAYASKVRANITACVLMKDKNISNANKLMNQTANLSVDDQQLYAKIEASEKTNPCGFKTFEDYAGGQRYKEFLDRTIITPYKYDNFKASIGRKGLGIMFYGPPGTGTPIQLMFLIH